MDIEQLNIKAKFGGELRRFTVQKPRIAFDRLIQHLAKLFKIEDMEGIRVAYRDDEGDLITCSTTPELVCGINIARAAEPPILRLEISTVSPAAPVAAPEARELDGGASAIKDAVLPLLHAFAPSLHKTPEVLAEDIAKLAGSFDISIVEEEQQPQEQPQPENVPRGCHGRVPLRNMWQHMRGAPAQQQAVHFGVECDKSGMNPIVGPRFHKRGENYDLCLEEFEKLREDDKSLFERIDSPVFPGCGFGRWRGGGGGARGHGPPHGRGTPHGPHGRAGFGGRGRGFVPSGKPAGKPAGGAPKHALQARFVSDVTIFDGTEVLVNSPFTKIWRLRNEGTVAFPENTKLLFVGGDKLGDFVEMSVGSVAPGEEFQMSVDLRAPNRAGRYVSYFRLAGGEPRRRFGHRVWVDVLVVDSFTDDTAVVERAFAEASPTPHDHSQHEVCDEEDETEPDVADDAAPGVPEAAAVTENGDDAAPEEIVEPTRGADNDASSSASSVSGVLIDLSPNDDGAEVDDAQPHQPALTVQLIPDAAPEAAPAFVDQHRLLSEMGFLDVEANEALLSKHSGDIQHVLRDLL